MSRHATEQGGGGGFRPEIGIHNVICCQLVDLGTHEKEWQGKVVGKANQVNMAFEFVDVTLDGESGEYHPIWGFNVTNSLGKKANLRKLLEGWRGKAFTEEELKGFDLDKLLGLSCTLVVQENANGNPKVVAISKCAQNLQGFREKKSFWIEDDFDGNIPDWLPEWMQETIADSEEFLSLHEDSSPGVQEDDFDDPIPF